MTAKARARSKAPKRKADATALAAFEPPALESLEWITSPLRAYFAPKLFGLEHIHPTQPALYVGNHSIYGLLDLSLFATEVYREKDIYLRSLADLGHFSIPAWGDVLLRLGAVGATRENCEELMLRGEHVLVFPGAGREMYRRKGEQHKLFWKNRTGFVRLALRYGYPIVPFAQVGADDAFDILVDGDDIMKSPLGTLLERTGLAKLLLGGGESIFPISRGLGLTAFPRPERFYFSITEPIDTSKHAGKDDDDSIVYEIRDRVRDSIRDEIARLREYKKRDRETSYLRRIINRFA